MRTQTIGYENDRFDVSKIALGTCFFGTEIDEKASMELINKYIEAGGNLIDTARVYACWLENGDGASEKIIGKYLSENKIRDKVIISTKGGHPPVSDMQKSRLDRKNLESDLYESLEALKTDYTDIYFLHRDDERIPVSEIMPILHEFVAAGKVRLLGASNWSAKRIAEANAYANKNNLTPFGISQIQWSLAKTSPEQIGDTTLVCMNDQEYSWYKQNNFPVMAFSPQSKGFFSKALKDGLDNLNAKIKKRFVTDENIQKLSVVKEISEKEGISPAGIVLSYITNSDIDGIAIVGCSNTLQLIDSMTAADFVLSEDYKAKLM